MSVLMKRLLNALALKFGYTLMPVASIEHARLVSVQLFQAVKQSGHLSWRYNVRVTLEDLLFDMQQSLRVPDFKRDL